MLLSQRVEELEERQPLADECNPQGKKSGAI
jgi:hypothetical protein